MKIEEARERIEEARQKAAILESLAVSPECASLYTTSEALALCRLLGDSASMRPMFEDLWVIEYSEKGWFPEAKYLVHGAKDLIEQGLMKVKD